MNGPTFRGSLDGCARRFFLARLLPAVMLGACIAFVKPALARVPYHHDIDNPRCCLFIAHAGGGIDGNPYTNSEEAVRTNLAMGVRVFEIDFSPTRDGVWVGTHDWSIWRKQTGYTDSRSPSLAEFSAYPIETKGTMNVPGSYTALTIPFLERIIGQHPGTTIVTDTKYDALKLAAALKETRLFGQIVPQAYSFEDVDAMRGLGYKKIVLTIYRMSSKDPRRLVSRVAAMRGKIHALTVPMDYFAAHHRLLANAGVPVYVHGAPSHINSRSLHHTFMRKGAAGFYLD